MLDIDKLEKLAELKKNKLLTEEEFIEEKKKLFEINNTKVTNVFVWMLAFLPLFVSLFLTVTKTHLTEGELIAIYFLANSILCAIDDRCVQKVYEKSNLMWLFFVPVYLYKRSKTVGDDLSYFITEIICLIISSSF